MLLLGNFFQRDRRKRQGRDVKIDPGTPTSTITYGYSTGSWKDQLVSYDGQSIVYDAMGNPTTYRGKTLTWRGKQLTGITSGTDVISYSYDENGLRLQKTVNNVATDYYYNGSVLIGLVKGNDTLRFSYDAAGQVAMVEYEKPNETIQYYYLRNGQGDVVKIVDGSGNTVVEYTYDSWGKQLSCTGTLATTLGALNPFRYRGYVYDEETQWYYLKSRYYDPETCRFISADVLLSTGQGVLGHNCYAYCGSNSVNRIDPGGTSWAILVLVLLLGGIATAAGCKKRGPDGEHEPDAKPEPEDSFIYNPSDIDSQEFKQFQKDFGIIAIANKADFNAGLDKSIWGDQGQRPMDPAIRIHFGGQIAQNMFIEYAEKYGYEKLASNLAQLVVTKYNIGLERDYPRGYDAATIAKDIYGRLIGWSKGEQVFSDDYYIVYY